MTITVAKVWLNLQCHALGKFLMAVVSVGVDIYNNKTEIQLQFKRVEDIGYSESQPILRDGYPIFEWK